jgi:hypothetical protein
MEEIWSASRYSLGGRRYDQTPGLARVELWAQPPGMAREERWTASRYSQRGVMVSLQVLYSKVGDMASLQA